MYYKFLHKISAPINPTGIFPKKFPRELRVGILVDFSGPFSLEEQDDKIYTKIHSKIQIRSWELRGQYPHRKDLPLIKCSLTTCMYAMISQRMVVRILHADASWSFGAGVQIMGVDVVWNFHTGRQNCRDVQRGPNWGLFFVPACPPLTAIVGYPNGLL